MHAAFQLQVYKEMLFQLNDQFKQFQTQPEKSKHISAWQQQTY